MDYTKLASSEAVQKTIKALGENNIEGVAVDTKEEALEKIKELIPEGASVMNGSSRTLEQIGFIDYLMSDEHNWKNLKGAILDEKDEELQAKLRRESVLSDYYLGSVHALSEDGQLVIASNTGSQLPHIVYTSPNLIFVVSAKKITPTLRDALMRLEDHVVPLEDKRIMEAYGVHTVLSKILIFKKENPMSSRKIQVIIVNEDLGL